SRTVTVVARVPRADGDCARWLPIRSAHRALLVHRRDPGQLEGLRRHAPGAVPRADRAPEPATRHVRRAGAGLRLRGTALSARRAAPDVHFAGDPPVEPARRSGEADG